MSQSLLWIGSSDPPAVVTRLADRHGWTVRTTNPGDGVAAATTAASVAILVGDDAGVDYDRLRATVAETPIAYCPATTTADGVAAAAGADFVLPQDATAWGVDALDEQLSVARATDAPVASGSGAMDGNLRESDETADIRREHERLWTLFENLPDPVVDAEHVGEGPVIRAANDAFSEVFDCDREAIAGCRIDEVLTSPGEAVAGNTPPEEINEQVREGEVTGAKVRRETANGARTFLFRGIPYAENGTVRAFGIYTDVTEIERRERHVKVLDRLLRHNLRNDLGVVIGRAENVIDRTDDPVIEEEATSLVQAADRLIGLSNTAKRIRRIIENPVAERSRTELPKLLDSVADDARDRFPRATIDAAADDADLAVLATSDLRLALEELVENAVVHGSDTPTVELRAEPYDAAPDEWVDLLVIDDGPGIPEAERAAVTGTRDITQLQHGSGLGLWLVRWAVESVGGDVGFDRREDRTVVRLRIRRATGG